MNSTTSRKTSSHSALAPKDLRRSLSRTSRRNENAKKNGGFTLIELLVVIAIIAILAVVVVLTLNPAELMRQARDANRISDMANLNSAISLYQTDQAIAGSISLGSSSVAYLSTPDPAASSTSDQCQGLGLPLATNFTYNCGSTTSSRAVNGTGWIPVDFQSISSGSPLSSLPADPVNQTSSNLYYVYQTNGNTFALSAFMESQKYAKTMQANGGMDPALYQIGSGISTLPPDIGRGLIGYWPLNEGTGNVALDYSGNNATGTWGGAQTGTSGYYSPGYVWTWGGKFDGSTNVVTTTANGVNTATGGANTVSFWMYPTSFGKVAWSLGTFDYYLSAPTCSGINNSGSVYGGTAPAMNQWVYVTMVLYNGTYGSNGSKIYYNGVPLSMTCNSGTATAVAGSQFLIGNFYGGGTHNFAGMLDDVRVYNRALTAGEVQELYNAEK